jgi:hypothetical protein
MLDSDYAHAEVPKAPPEMPVRVILNSQLIAALRQHARPIVIEDQVLARPFVRLLRARDSRLGTVGALLAERISHAINRYYGADIEAHWYIGQLRPAGQRVGSAPGVFLFGWADSRRQGTSWLVSLGNQAGEGRGKSRLGLRL